MKIPRAESLILFAFLVCVALWAISKCSSRRSDIVRKVRDIDLDDKTEERPQRQDTLVASTPAQPGPANVKPTVSQPQTTVTVPPPAPTQYTSTLRQPGAEPPKPSASKDTAPKTAAKPVDAATKSGTTLYVTIEGLKVRKEPGLKGETLETLELYAPVTFLNQKTEWTQEISLGYEKVTDHWVKIKTAAGKTGWVFGAGLHFYKMKRTGVIPDTKTATPAVPKKKNR